MYSPSGRCTSCSARQRQNTRFPKDSTCAGISIRSSFTQSSNAPAPILRIPLGSVIVCISRHPRNAPAPISSRLSGKITLLMVSIFANASSAIRVMPSGTTTLDSAPRYRSSIVPLTLKFPSTCPCMTRTTSGTTDAVSSSHSCPAAEDSFCTSNCPESVLYMSFNP